MAQPSFMRIWTSWKDQEIINHGTVNLMLDEQATISHDYSPSLRSRKLAIRQRMMKNRLRMIRKAKPEAKRSWKRSDMVLSSDSIIDAAHPSSGSSETALLSIHDVFAQSYRSTFEVCSSCG